MNSQVIYVLLVEDDIDYSALLRRRLMGTLNQTSETTFVVAQTGFLQEAVEYATTNTVDVIVLDLNLPDALGMETLERMREAAPHAATIVLTGRDDQELATQALQMGAQDYLCKGHFNTELLVRAIRYAIDRKQSEAALSQAEAQLRSINGNQPPEGTTTQITQGKPQTNQANSPSAVRRPPQMVDGPATSNATAKQNGKRDPAHSDDVVNSNDIATDFDNLLSHMAAQNSLALSALGNDNPARVHVEKLHHTINLATDLTKRFFNGLRNGG